MKVLFKRSAIAAGLLLFFAVGSVMAADGTAIDRPAGQTGDAGSGAEPERAGADRPGWTRERA